MHFQCVRTLLVGVLSTLLLVAASQQTLAAELVIADGGKTTAVIAVAEQAGSWESRAAEDLAHYVEQMSGAKPEIVSQLPEGNTPVLVVGELALAAKPELAARLKSVAKTNPVLRADAITLLRDGNRVLL